MATTARASEIDVRERPEAGNGRGQTPREHDTDDIEGLRRDELYHLAQELDIHGRSQMNKEELKQALQDQN